MKTTYLFLATLFIFSVSLNAQKNAKTLSKAPVSIYTFSNFSTGKNGFSAINKKLKLSNFNFVFVDGIDLDLNRFSINAKNINIQPSEFIYDDYQRYLDRNLLKGFLLKNDPTRWNLQCPQPNLQL
jgi:hypothetical protein